MNVPDREAHIAELLRSQPLTQSLALRAKRHVARCEPCRNDVSAALAAQWTELARTLELERNLAGEHLDPETELYPFVEGRLDAADAEIVLSHLDECASCREDVESVRSVALPAPAKMRRAPRTRWIATAAAAGLASALALSYVWSRPDATTPAPSPRTATRAGGAVPVLDPPLRPAYARADWGAAVERVLTTGRLPHIETTVARTPDAVRSTELGRGRILEPLPGAVVDTTRPRFAWTPIAGAVYHVTIFRGEREIARSAPLRDAHWTPTTDLPRGATCVWQVEVSTESGTYVIPPAAEEFATFTILSAKKHEEIAAARAAHPGDHLLIAVLYARAGAKRHAHEELRKLQAAGKLSPPAARLLATELGRPSG